MKNTKITMLVVLTLTAALALTACATTSTTPMTQTSPGSAAAQPAAQPETTIDGAQNMSTDMPQAMVTKLTAEAAKQMIDQGNVTVVDVRTADEYAQAHVPGALLLTNETIDAATAAALLPDADTTVMVYCRSGRRSAEAANKLLALGYTQIYDFGGIIDWPYETEVGAYTE